MGRTILDLLRRAGLTSAIFSSKVFMRLLFSLLLFLIRAKCVSSLVIHMLSDTLFRFYEPFLRWCEARISVCPQIGQVETYLQTVNCDGSACSAQRECAPAGRAGECSCPLPGMQDGECGQAKKWMQSGRESSTDSSNGPKDRILCPLHIFTE